MDHPVEYMDHPVENRNHPVEYMDHPVMELNQIYVEVNKELLRFIALGQNKLKRINFLRNFINGGGGRKEKTCLKLQQFFNFNIFQLKVELSLYVFILNSFQLL